LAAQVQALQERYLTLKAVDIPQERGRPHIVLYRDPLISFIRYTVMQHADKAHRAWQQFANRKWNGE
jgi:hypothetical protein